ncbi:MAG: hypothetical protein ABIT37_15660, partial [Luteolibacter sp.]
DTKEPMRVRLSFFHMRDQSNGSRHPFQRRIKESPLSGSVQQDVEQQPAITLQLLFISLPFAPVRSL